MEPGVSMNRVTAIGIATAIEKAATGLPSERATLLRLRGAKSPRRALPRISHRRLPVRSRPPIRSSAASPAADAAGGAAAAGVGAARHAPWEAEAPMQPIRAPRAPLGRIRDRRMRPREITAEGPQRRRPSRAKRSPTSSPRCRLQHPVHHSPPGPLSSGHRVPQRRLPGRIAVLTSELGVRLNVTRWAARGADARRAPARRLR
jgi:hypothetical protein